MRVKSIRREIDELRKQLPEKTTKQGGTDRERFQTVIFKAIEPILQTMREDHKEELLTELELWFQDKDYYSRTLSILFKALDKDSNPVYLGPEFYEAYKEGFLNLHSCEDCGCGIPILGGYAYIEKGQLINVSARTITDKCPLCGGKTGYATHYLKRSGKGA